MERTVRQRGRGSRTTSLAAAVPYIGTSLTMSTDSAAYPLQTQAQHPDFVLFCKPAQFTHHCHAELDLKKKNN